YLYDGGDRAYYATLPGSPGLQYEWILEDVGSGQVEIRNAGTNEYMHIENQTGYVQCTSRTPGWGSSRWVLEDAGDGFIRLQNVWQPAQYAHIENLLGYAQHGTISTGWWSAMWALEVVPKNANGITESGAESLTVNTYPNPVTDGFVTVQISGISDFVNLRVMNIQGAVVYESEENSSEFYLDLTGYNEGLYFIVVQTGNEIISKKLVIQ
ncbi:MAG: T9SS type A sorting domain-containing protein, partial [Bacteroidales bacterium]|nr:T9SS type A sorting domain-containing protein [Bacteroidales bacterium]